MSGGIFTNETIRRIRLFTCLENAGPEILRAIIFACIEEKYEVIVDSIKGKLLPYEKATINSSTSPESFDISLLASIIRIKLQGTDNFGVYKMIKPIKDYRNYFFHEPNPLSEEEFERQIVELEGMFRVCLVEALDVSIRLQKSSLTPENLTKVEKAYNELEQLLYRLPSLIQAIMNDDIDTLKKRTVDLMLKSCQSEIYESYEKLTRINSLEFLLGKECTVPVEDVFAPMTLYNENERIEVVDLLDYLKNTEKNILFEGAAGFGKTSIVKYLLSKHLKGSFISKDTLVIYMSCRDDQFDSLESYLFKLFPSTKLSFGQEFCNYCFSKLKLIFMLDGIDEISNQFKKIFKEIKFKVTREVSRLLCTSRPEGVELFLLNIPNNALIKLRGMSVQGQELAIKNYWKLFNNKSPNIPEESRKKIVNNLTFTNRSPLFICLITYLSACEDEIYRIRSTTELMREITRILENRLKCRLIALDKRVSECKCFIEGFLDKLGYISLDLINKNERFLSSQDESTLRKYSCDHKFKEDEGLSAFLLTEGKIVGIGGHEIGRYTYFHYVFQEFLSARAIAIQLNESTEVSTEDPIEKVQTLTLLCQVAGILALSGRLTDSLCKKMLNRNRHLNGYFDFIIKETKGTDYYKMMLSAVSDVFQSLAIYVEDIDQLEQGLFLLGKECPMLKKVTIRIVTSDGLPQLRDIFKLLKRRKNKICLEIFCCVGKEFTYPKLSADEIDLHFNESVNLTLGHATITKAGVEKLPPRMESLSIFIKNKEEMEALRLLGERIKEKKFFVESLVLLMCEGWDQHSSQITKFDFEIPHLMITFFNTMPENCKTEFKFIKKIKIEKISNFVVRFNGSFTFSYDDTKKLISSLVSNKIEVHELQPSSQLSFSEYCTLHKKCAKELECDFSVYELTESAIRYIFSDIELINSLLASRANLNELCISSPLAMEMSANNIIGRDDGEYYSKRQPILDAFNKHLVSMIDQLNCKTITVELDEVNMEHLDSLYLQMQQGNLNLEALVIKINKEFDLDKLNEQYTLNLADLIFVVETDCWHSKIIWLVQLIEKFFPIERRRNIELTLVFWMYEIKLMKIEAFYKMLIKRKIKPKFIFIHNGSLSKEEQISSESKEFPQCFWFTDHFGEPVTLIIKILDSEEGIMLFPTYTKHRLEEI